MNTGTAKHPSTRRRRNVTPGARTLFPAPNTAIDIPSLPLIRDWHPLTVESWRRVHESPMYPEYDDSDISGLIRLAVLWDEFYTSNSVANMARLSGEIRQCEARYGLSPMDRRKLSWVIDAGEAAEQRTQRRRNKVQVRRIGAEDDAGATMPDDPRELLA